MFLRINIVKMTILSKAIYRINEIPFKLSMTLFIELEQKISQFIWKHKWLQIAKGILRKKYGTGDINLPAFRLQNYSDQDSIELSKKRNIDKWSKRESPEINPCTYRHLIFYKGGKDMQWGKDILLNKWYQENWIFTCKRMKLEYYTQK